MQHNGQSKVMKHQKIKLTKEQKQKMSVVLAANKYFEALKNQTEKESERWFFEQLEEIINKE